MIRRRLRHAASDLPSERQTRWDQKLQRAARTARSFKQRRLRDSTGPLTEADEQEWRQEDADRSGGTTGELSTERPVGREDDWERPGAEGNESVSASGDGGARGEGQAPWQGSGPQAPEALPGEPGRHAQQQLPRWPRKTAVWPDGGGIPDGTWPRLRTELKTDTSARLRGDTAQETGGHGAEGQKPAGGPRASGRNQDSGSRETGRAASRQQARIYRALRFQISRVMLA